MTIRHFVAALVAVTIVCTGAATVHAQAPGAKPPTPAEMNAQIKASMKQRFGFSDAQATKAIVKVSAIQKVYMPQMMALQKKYGANPTPEQRQKMQSEAMPLYMKMSKEVETAVMAIATPEQRAKVKAQMQSGKPKG